MEHNCAHSAASNLTGFSHNATLAGNPEYCRYVSTIYKRWRDVVAFCSAFNIQYLYTHILFHLPYIAIHRHTHAIPPYDVGWFCYSGYAYVFVMCICMNMYVFPLYRFALCSSYRVPVYFWNQTIVKINYHGTMTMTMLDYIACVLGAAYSIYCSRLTGRRNAV